MSIACGPFGPKSIACLEFTARVARNAKKWKTKPHTKRSTLKVNTCALRGHAQSHGESTF
eukprot:scaffold309726_cov30-Tisochrysis_lutea.AAC.3